MSRRNEFISGERDWEKRNRRDRFVCGCRKGNDVRDESFRHCGCLDCRRRRNRGAI